MKRYYITEDRIVTVPSTIKVNGVVKLTKDMTNKELVILKYLPITYGSFPDRRYYTAIENKKVIDDLYTITYTPKEKPLENIQNLLLKSVSESFKTFSKRPVVDTGLGFNVDGGLDDLQRFEIGKELGITVMMDKQGIPHTVKTEDYDAVILAIKTYGLKLYQAKWARETEIKSFTTVKQCITYEHTPYTVKELVVDKANEPILDKDGKEQYKDVTKYKNLTKEW